MALPCESTSRSKDHNSPRRSLSIVVAISTFPLSEFRVLPLGRRDHVAEVAAKLIEVEHHRLVRQFLSDVVQPFLDSPQLLDAGVKEFVAQYQKQFPGMAIAVPGNVFHNAYMGTRELLRCVQEAVTNAVRHAGATQVRVSLVLHGEGDAAEVRVQVDDNGRGTRKLREGNGLKGMQERMAELGGAMRVLRHQPGFLIELNCPRRA